MINKIKSFLGQKTSSPTMSPDDAFLAGVVDWMGGTSGSIASAYASSAVAYAAIRRIAIDAGNAPFLLLRDPDDPESTIPETDPIYQLFNNPHPQFNTVQFFEMIYTYLELRGEFFITFDDSRNPRTMFPFYDPLYWTESVTTSLDLTGWLYQHNTVGFGALPSDIIHHKLISISNPFRGQSPLLAAASNVSTEIRGDDLGADLMSRGGEQGIVYTTDDKMTEKQESELTAGLRGRKAGDAKVANDILLTGGVGIMDPKFTGFDYKVFDLIGPSEQKILQVYGLSPSLIGRDDEPNYATFQGRLRVYWRQTLLPLLGGVESAMDSYLERFGVYFRYDKANIQGLQEDMKELSQIALILNRGGIPWDVINERLSLGLDTASIPGSDEIMVPATVAPLSVLLDEYGNEPEPEPTPEAPEQPESDDEDEEEPEAPDGDEEEDKGSPAPIRRELMVSRAKDIGSLVARNRALAGLERAVTTGWRKLASKYKGKAVAEWEKAVEQNRTLDGAVQQFSDLFAPKMNEGMSTESVLMIAPRHIASAGIGEASVEEMTKRLSDADLKFMKEEPESYLSPASRAFIAERENMVANMAPALFNSMMADINELVASGGEVGEISGAIRHSFNVSINRAATIGRTEVGTAFNVGRVSNMQEQGYTHHEWVTHIDEFTRDGIDSEFNHVECDTEIRRIGEVFTCDLTYPQAPGGEAGNVINCRCMTIPLTEEQANERSEDS